MGSSLSARNITHKSPVAALLAFSSRFLQFALELEICKSEIFNFRALVLDLRLNLFKLFLKVLVGNLGCLKSSLRLLKLAGDFSEPQIEFFFLSQRCYVLVFNFLFR